MPQKGTRPTSDRVREALFNVLSAQLDFTDMTVLDLYAGSGALGLEALSRGATAATFVEIDPRNAKVIERNAAALGLTGAVVIARPVAAVLASGGTAPADLVLADPPYDTAVGDVDAVLVSLATQGWTAAGTVVAVERRASSPPLTWPAGWEMWPQRRYGDTRLDIGERT
ncbi:MAG: rRNA (guanine966-N2)-methyltransferase [Mycobacterium sp.]|nr:rRNA (guanine966-N2)-methyltransferase [Mycobacterium sp.]